MRRDRLAWATSAGTVAVLADATAQLRQSGSILVSCTGKAAASGSAFTPSSFDSYTLDPAANVPALVKAYAGPQADIGARQIRRPRRGNRQVFISRSTRSRPTRMPSRRSCRCTRSAP
ncbi:hypothetical protein CLV67_13743 [Actinoplanes italicus]|uniref:Uncharacterized protein n=1 Tax=Actinoplanes italicus TaxID=113567 RepID=A0A2T0JNG9_9ACTN|nr:hypothetical protein CLV67_13743 [Actinoplanes italicus]